MATVRVAVVVKELVTIIAPLVTVTVSTSVLVVMLSICSVTVAVIQSVTVTVTVFDPVVVELPDAPPLRALAWKEMESSERLEGVEQVSLPGTARMFAQRWG